MVKNLPNPNLTEHVVTKRIASDRTLPEHTEPHKIILFKGIEPKAPSGKTYLNETQHIKIQRNATQQKKSDHT